MNVSYETLVAFSKSWGLIYMMSFFLCVCVYAFWPRNKERFDRAKNSILGQDDKPWRE